MDAKTTWCAYWDCRENLLDPKVIGSLHGPSPVGLTPLNLIWYWFPLTIPSHWNLTIDPDKMVCLFVDCTSSLSVTVFLISISK